MVNGQLVGGVIALDIIVTLVTAKSVLTAKTLAMRLISVLRRNCALFVKKMVILGLIVVTRG